MKACLLADGDVKLTESHVVSEYLDTAYPQAGPKLFPSDAAGLAKVILESCIMKYSRPLVLLQFEGKLGTPCKPIRLRI